MRKRAEAIRHSRRHTACGFIALLALAACSDPAGEGSFDPITAVDPLIGTGGLGFAVGSIAPGPRLPFGMANPSLDTAKNGGAPGFSHCAGYYYEDDQARGFSQIHLSGTGVPDYGALLLMPMSEDLGDRPLNERAYRDRFDHHRERAEVGAYAVHLLDADVDVEVTATARGALYRLTYPSGRPANLVVDLDHGLGGGETSDGRLSVDGRRLSGWLHHAGDLSGRYGGFDLFFAIELEQAPERVRLFSDAYEVEGVTEVSGARSAALIELGTDLPGPLLVKVGLSFVDEASARADLDREQPGFDYEGTKAKAQEAWRRILSKIRVRGGSDEDRTKLYTALYHAYQMPTLLSGGDGRYRGVDGKIHRAEGFRYYSDFSLWDTFRTAHPLFTLLTPEIQEDFNRSLIRMLEDGGHLPRWPLAHGYTWTMLGNHGESMLIDAYLRGAGGFDPERAYGHLFAAANGPVESGGVTRAARECIDRYLELGFCPADESSGATSRTLENAYNDWMLGNLAQALGHEEDAGILHERAGAWRKQYNPETGFLMARMADGSFASDFDDALFSDDFVEGNSRQWTVYVPHDSAGLAEAMGGDEALIGYLERFFSEAAGAEKTILPDLWYWHGNEPDIHAAYVFSELGRRDLTARWVSWIMDERYGTGPDGLDGNDDGGTLSAWYVFSALGFFPLAGSDRYYVGHPRFDRVEIDVASDPLVVEVDGGDTVRLDGEDVQDPYVTHAALADGGTLTFPALR